MSPWPSIPYSDPLTVFIPVTILALYLKVNNPAASNGASSLAMLQSSGVCDPRGSRQMRRNVLHLLSMPLGTLLAGINDGKRNVTAETGWMHSKTWLWGIIFLLGIIGYHIKPQTVIILIAVVIAAILDNKIITRKSLKKLLIVFLFCAIGIFLGAATHKIAYHEFNKRIPIDEERAFSYYHWMMMGLNDANNGLYNRDDVNYSKSFGTREERIAEQKKIIKERLKKYAADGYLIDFFANKTAICYSDGTFSWSTGASDFYGIIYDGKTPLSPLLRNIFYYHGAAYPAVSTVQQLVWISILFLCILSGIKKNVSSVELVLYLTFMGAALFELIFEIFPRHLYCNVPCFIILAMCGLGNVQGIFSQSGTVQK